MGLKRQSRTGTTKEIMLEVFGNVKIQLKVVTTLRSIFELALLQDVLHIIYIGTRLPCVLPLLKRFK